MNDKIYIIGHKTPDLDSVAAAISYADFKNNIEETDKYIPAVPGKMNKETEYALEKFKFAKPEELQSVENKNIILVDHNEFSQAAAGAQKANIIGVLDHHKVDFKYNEPILFNIKPWGATCSMIADMYFKLDLEPGKELAGLMLSAILVDTVLTKSPTCTEIDKIIIEKLADIAEIEDWEKFGLELFKVRSSVSDLSIAEIVKSDYKDFSFSAGKFGIGQVETADLAEFKVKEEELFKEIKNIKESGDYHTVILMITDIINEGSWVLAESKEPELIEKALEIKFENNKAYKKGLLSRKKQVVPKFI
ncbi:manganese-dependent inorganic pyrophosphatase [Candidatus Falkowbacteria bacterium]|nr:MAG: manganese-dependent inorganic pyrophosphatase [Candidatus Falkowbacteria bacterium]